MSANPAVALVQPQIAAEIKRRVTPLAVFAAGRMRFEVLISGFAPANAAKAFVFADLPLEEHGWDWDRCKVTHLRNVDRGMIFLIERG